ncbi:unnamed protein product [Cylicostephanus goldi]|uniref:Uncharacterized protein n=1 Tax=Cylicostephanus goldi TaxID=71465 RepID=A0A3P6RA46_CYLGO|nr:unnamed protein product [Cylicostephanus goldi]
MPDRSLQDYGSGITVGGGYYQKIFKYSYSQYEFAVKSNFVNFVCDFGSVANSSPSPLGNVVDHDASDSESEVDEEDRTLVDMDIQEAAMQQQAITRDNELAAF